MDRKFQKNPKTGYLIEKLNSYALVFVSAASDYSWPVDGRKGCGSHHWAVAELATHVVSRQDFHVFVPGA